MISAWNHKFKGPESAISRHSANSCLMENDHSVGINKARSCLSVLVDVYFT